MPDDADLSQAVIDLQLQLALAACAGRYIGESLSYCEECGEAIPEARRRAVPGVRLCVVCQEDAEDAC